jgi:hypothetical protein
LIVFRLMFLGTLSLLITERFTNVSTPQRYKYYCSIGDAGKSFEGLDANRSATVPPMATMHIISRLPESVGSTIGDIKNFMHIQMVHMYPIILL